VDVSKNKNSYSKHSYVQCIEISLPLICKCCINVETLTVLQPVNVITSAMRWSWNNDRTLQVTGFLRNEAPIGITSAFLLEADNSLRLNGPS
jgi:hypothetical protein